MLALTITYHPLSGTGDSLERTSSPSDCLKGTCCDVCNDSKKWHLTGTPLDFSNRVAQLVEHSSKRPVVGSIPTLVTHFWLLIGCRCLIKLVPEPFHMLKGACCCFKKVTICRFGRFIMFLSICHCAKKITECGV